MENSTASDSRFMWSDVSSATSRFGGLLDEVDNASASASSQRKPAQKAAAVDDDTDPVERAVFSHITAMRTLGHTTANTEQIAKALGLPRTAVEKAVTRLRELGVKVVGR